MLEKTRPFGSNVTSLYFFDVPDSALPTIRHDDDALFPAIINVLFVRNVP